MFHFVLAYVLFLRRLRELRHLRALRRVKTALKSVSVSVKFAIIGYCVR